MAIYERVQWEDSPSRLTPINAENLNTMDAGIAALVDEFNSYISGENERIAELNDIKEQLERRIDALCEVPNIEKVREYVASEGYKIENIAPKPILTSDFRLGTWATGYEMTMMSNASFAIGNTVHLNLKFGWNYNLDTTLVSGGVLSLCAVPEAMKPTDEVSVIVNDNAPPVGSGGHFEGWIRTTGEIVIVSRGNTTAIRQIRVIGSYIIN